MIYDTAIWLYALLMRLAAPFHPKAKSWAKGRAVFPSAPWPKGSARVLWVHAASLGEFEQGRPVMEAFRARFPEWKVVLSFFSPSGYEVRKGYAGADWVCYMPADTRPNARRFVEEVSPDAAVFVKYEFWANHLAALRDRGVPTFLISAAFRPSQPFFKWYGSFWREMLGCFSHIFVQDEGSARCLRQIGFERFTVAGDTRVDRVLQIARDAQPNPVLEKLAQAAEGEGVLIAGSSWLPDEELLLGAFAQSSAWPRYLVIAPHDPSEANVARICRQAAALGSVRYSEATGLSAWPEGARCLVIDNVGMLNALYRYGDAAYIGGGFGKGIHNTLEPAAYGLPVVFGPNYHKFEEAKQMLARGGAFCAKDIEALRSILLEWGDPVLRQRASGRVRAYLFESQGATEKVLGFLAEVAARGAA